MTLGSSNFCFQPSKHRFLVVMLLLASLAAGLGGLPAEARTFSKWNPLHYVPGLNKPDAPSKTDDTSPSAASDTVTTDTSIPETQAALLQTEKGDIGIKLFTKEAPRTVENFVHLARDNFYNSPNMKFHRVVPGFVIQTGDPTGTGAGGARNTIPLEVNNKLSHNAKGMVAMARGVDPNSASSQFYITLAPETYLDGKYAVFGKVVSGLDVLDKIKLNDKVYGVQLVDVSALPKEDGAKRSSFGQGMKHVLTGKFLHHHEPTATSASEPTPTQASP